MAKLIATLERGVRAKAARSLDNRSTDHRMHSGGRRGCLAVRRRTSARTKCDTEANAIAEVWNDAVKTRLGDTLIATGAPFAESTIRHAWPHFDAHAEAWRSAYEDLCERTEVVGVREADLWQASHYCLQENLGQFATVVEVLIDGADVSAVQLTVPAASGLASVETCRDDRWLRRHPAPTDVASNIEELRRRLWRAEALRVAGKYREGLDLARAVIDESDSSGDPGLRRSAVLIAGRLSMLTGDERESERLLSEVFRDALGNGADDQALEAATALVHLVGFESARDEEGLLWGEVAGGLVARLEFEDDQRPLPWTATSRTSTPRAGPTPRPCRSESGLKRSATE